MGLSREQGKFAHAVAVLIFHISSKGYYVTFGDAYAKSGHKDGSFHYQRLAIDLNLFDKDGNYLADTEDHRQFGEFWKSIDSKCTWGGDFKKKDGNHYSWGE